MDKDARDELIVQQVREFVCGMCADLFKDLREENTEYCALDADRVDLEARIKPVHISEGEIKISAQMHTDLVRYHQLTTEQTRMEIVYAYMCGMYDSRAVRELLSKII